MANSDIEKYLKKLPPHSQGICEKLRLIAQTQMPEAHQMIYHGAICFASSPSKFSPFVYIAPHTNWVNLGFFFGAGLPDPKKLLLGERVRMRHIKIRNEKEANNPAIKHILKAAWKKAHDNTLKNQVKLKPKKKNSPSVKKQ